MPSARASLRNAQDRARQQADRPHHARGRRKTNMRLRILLVLALALGSSLADDQASERRLENLNVIAVDSRGEPVTDLTSDDFQVTDAGKPQKIAFFRHTDSKLWQVPALAPNEVSNR